jgi:hypothetical protein
LWRPPKCRKVVTEDVGLEIYKCFVTHNIDPFLFSRKGIQMMVKSASFPKSITLIPFLVSQRYDRTNLPLFLAAILHTNVIAVKK